MSAAPRPYVGAHNPPARLIWALDGPPDSPIPLTRDMRRGKPVCHHHYQFRDDNARTDSVRAALLADMDSFFEGVEQSMRRRFGRVRYRWFEQAWIFAGPDGQDHPGGMTQVQLVIDAMRGEENWLYRWLTGQGMGGAPARSRYLRDRRRLE